jgi:hypothetical protein
MLRWKLTAWRVSAVISTELVLLDATQIEFSPADDKIGFRSILARF